MFLNIAGPNQIRIGEEFLPISLNYKTALLNALDIKLTIIPGLLFTFLSVRHINALILNFFVMTE